MSRRREANRAEAIVKGIGALVMLGALWLLSRFLPDLLKGKAPNEMLGTMMKVITGFVVLGMVISIIGLIVWVKVRRGGWSVKRGPGQLSGTTTKGWEMDQASIACPRCGKPMVLKDGKYGTFWGCSTFPKCRGTREVAAEK